MLHQELMQEEKVQKALQALGEEGEEITLAFTTKQVTDRSEKRVYAGLSFRALYLFEKDFSHYLRCRERVDIMELVGISIAKGDVELGLRCQRKEDNVVLRFTRKNDGGRRNAQLLVEEIRMLHEDLRGKELPVMHESAADLKSLLSAKSKDRVANLTSRIMGCCAERRSSGTSNASRVRMESYESSMPFDNPFVAEAKQASKFVNKAPSFADIMQGKTKGLPGRGGTAGQHSKGMDGAAAAAVREIQDCLAAIQGGPGSTVKAGHKGGAGPEREGQRLLSCDPMDTDSVVDAWVSLGLKGQLPQALSLPGLGQRQEMAGKDLCEQVHNNYQQFIQAAGAATSIDSELSSLTANLKATAALLAHLEDLPTTSKAKIDATEEGEDGVAQGAQGERAGMGGGGGAGEVPGWRVQFGRGLVEELDERVQALFDEIDALMVEHKYEQAVGKVEEGGAMVDKGAGLAAHPRRMLQNGLRQRSTALVQAIWQQVDSLAAEVETNAQQAVDHPVSLLLRLKHPQNAVQMLLTSRTGFWEREMSAIQTRADTSLTHSIGRLCKLSFSCILQTAQDFRKLFPGREMLPALMSWSSSILKAFVHVFSREVFISEDLSVVGDCVHSAKEHCRQLSKQGMSLEVQLDQALLGPLAQLISSSFLRIREAVQPAVAKESWKGRRVGLASLQRLDDSDGGAVRGRNGEEERDESVYVTDSAAKLYSRAYRLVHVIREDAGMDLGAELGERLTAELEDLLAWYTAALAPAAERLGPLSLQALSILGNLEHLFSPLVPSLFPPSLASLSGHHSASSTEQRDKMWARIRDAKLKEVLDALHWTSVDYSRSSLNTATAKPSERIQRMMAQVSLLGESARDCLGEDRAKQLLRQVLQGVVDDTVASEKFWHRYLPQGQPCGFGHGGLQQLVLDLRFMLGACKGVAPEGSASVLRKSLEENIDRAVMGYCMAMDEEPESVLQSDAWHDGVTRKTLLAMSSITKGLFIAGYDRS